MGIFSIYDIYEWIFYESIYWAPVALQTQVDNDTGDNRVSSSSEKANNNGVFAPLDDQCRYGGALQLEIGLEINYYI